MDVLLILATSLAKNILSGNVSPNTDEGKRSAIYFLGSQAARLAVNAAGATSYGLTNEQRTDLSALLIFAAVKLDGGES